MSEGRQPARIDWGGLASTPKVRPAIDPSTSHAALEDAKAAGFSGRAEQAKVDGRSLRRTGRTAQLNIKLRPETRDAFLQAAAKFPDTEQFVAHLLRLLNAGGPG
jgi:hypothetical protein